MLSFFEALRKSLLENGNIYKLAQLGTATFEDVSNTNALGFAMFVWQEGNSSNTGTYLRIGTGNYLKDQNKDKAKLLQEQYRKFVVPKSSFSEIPGYPLIYWWTEEFREKYKSAEKIGEVGKIRQGMISGDNYRFIRSTWELKFNQISFKGKNEKIFYPYLKGADGRRWIDDTKNVIKYYKDGLEFDLFPSARHQNYDSFFQDGVYFSRVSTQSLYPRISLYASIYDVNAPKIEFGNIKQLTVFFNSILISYVSQSINPTIANQVGDVQKLPIFPVPEWEKYFQRAKSLYDHYFSLKRP